MGKVLFGLSVSLDGFIAVTNDDVSLLDESHLNFAPVLLGEGFRLFDHLGSEPIHLERIRALETPGATHLSFRVVK